LARDELDGAVIVGRREKSKAAICMAALPQSIACDRLSPDGATESDQDACPDEANDQVDENAGAGVDAEHAQQEVQQRSTDDAENDVHEDAVIALHELFREPTRDAANDDCAQQSHAVQIHDPISFSIN
jgi:hypothetical protein